METIDCTAFGLEMRVVVAFAFCLAAVSAAPQITNNRIVGGTVTTINQYPFAVALLHSFTGTGWFGQSCGGSVLNSRSILTAAHCFVFPGFTEPWNWRIRVGSTWASSGGTVHYSAQIILHPQYNRATRDLDVGILRSATTITMIPNAVQPASIAGTSYSLPDNSPVTAIGWGRTSFGGQTSEQLRHVQVWTVNQNVCAQRYAELGDIITPNMLCSGWLDVGGRDQCQGDSGGPLLHYNSGAGGNVVVGVCSWGAGCALARYPGVNVRVSSATDWIQANAI